MAVSTNPASQSSRSRRVEFIDLLRGWAVIVMIETHVSNATLTEPITSSWLFQYIKFLNGLVAPSFLFASGLAYAITTRRKLNDYLSFGPLLTKQFGRLFFVLIIGYVLHLPKFNFNQLLHETTSQEWLVFYQADVLHCIAVSLLFMQAVLLVLKSERRLYLTLTVIAVGVLFVTPLMWGPDVGAVFPAPIAAYVNGLDHSLFPIFPWSAFLFAGAIVGYYYLHAKESVGPGAGNEERFMKSLSWFALSIIIVAPIIEPFAARTYPTYDYWRFSPSFVLLRLGIVLLLCVGMFFYEKRRGVSPRSVVTLIGRESLIVYVVHLLLIYGDFGTFNFTEYVNKSFGYVEAVVTTLVLFGLMYALALVWSRIKRGSPRLKRVLNFATLAIVLGVFFFGPGE
ncbi:MAG: DUF1624 domain-containing protein [Ignavibacteriae bacterium]|nr:DUF1624 domain-containing protein [Ignavibacteriota bacterium]